MTHTGVAGNHVVGVFVVSRWVWEFILQWRSVDRLSGLSDRITKLVSLLCSHPQFIDMMSPRYSEGARAEARKAVLDFIASSQICI